jgi:hypothetical protein
LGCWFFFREEKNIHQRKQKQVRQEIK